MFSKWRMFMSDQSSVTPGTSSTQLPNLAVAHREYGIAALGPLLNAPQLALMQATVDDYVREQSATARSRAVPILEARSRGVAAVTFKLATLLQLLSWERLVAANDALLSDEALDRLFEEMLSSDKANELGQRLVIALGWYGASENELVEPVILRQLVWKALILELDSDNQRKPGRVAGYDVGKAENWGKPLSGIQQEFEDFLKCETLSIQGYCCRNSARLAMRILGPIMPVLSVRKTPAVVRYGTLAWVNFAHGVALTEMLFPGSSQRLTCEELIKIPLDMSHLATDSERQIIVQTRLIPTIQWAITHNVLPERDVWNYSTSEIETAMAALDGHQLKVTTTLRALLCEVPDRLEIGRKTFNDVLGYNAPALHKLIMRPTTLGKNLEFGLRTPSSYIGPGRFYLIDLFVAGFMKNGLDKFEPHVSSEENFWMDAYSTDIERLKDIDINANYQEAFEAYSREAQTAYAFLIESLLSELPFLDRLAIEHGRVDLYRLESETGVEMKRETREMRRLRQGRTGFILTCTYNGSTFAYEVFPLLGLLQRRMDLHPLPHNGQLKTISNQQHRGGIEMPLDWAAYTSATKPDPGVISSVIPIHIDYGLASTLETAPSVSPLSSPRLRSIGETVASNNLFFDKINEFKAHQHQTGSELVSNTYPPVLRILEVLIPGLACFNAIKTGVRPVLSCAIDLGTVLAAPVFGFARGCLKIILRAGAPAVGRTLPSLARLTRTLFSSTANSYQSALIPFEGFLFRWNTNIGAAALLLKLAYSLNEAVGKTLGKPGESVYINGLESVAVPHKWRPIAVGDRLAMIFDVPNVPVRHCPAADNRVRTYLINTLSGIPYGPALDAEAFDGQATTASARTDSVT
jgi:hypothetical protein